MAPATRHDATFQHPGLQAASTEDIVKYSISGDGSRVKDAIQGVVANKVAKVCSPIARSAAGLGLL